MLLPLFAALVAASTALLIFAGGLVTSTGSGLSVPDWPNTYGWFMWAFPMSKMVGGIFYEHTHRLIASTVGFLIVVLAFWLGRAEPRRWVRRLGYLALGAVIAQGILGGITVLWYLPDAISIAHASLAQILFCLTVTIALVVSPGWKRGYRQLPTANSQLPRRSAGGGGQVGLNDRTLQRVAIVTTAVIYAQILRRSRFISRIAPARRRSRCSSWRRPATSCFITATVRSCGARRSCSWFSSRCRSRSAR